MCCLGNALLPLAGIRTTTWVIALITERLPDSQLTFWASVNLLLPAVTTLLVLALLSHLVSQALPLVVELSQSRMAGRFQLLILSKVSTIDYQLFENQEFHNRLQNATRDAEQRPFVAVYSIAQSISLLVALIILSTAMIRWTSWMFLLVALPVITMFAINAWLASKKAKALYARAGAERQAWYYRSLLTSDLAAKELRLLSLKDFFLGKFKEYQAAFAKEDSFFGTRKFTYSALVGAALSLNIPILVVYSASEVLRGAATIAHFNLFTQSIVTFHTSFARLLNTLGDLHENNLMLKSVFDFLSMQSAIENRPFTAGIAKLSSSPTLEFCGVSFHYPGTQQMVLRDVSFRVHPGEAVAIVGHNGAGKSTLVKLATGLYEPTSGSIRLDGIDIRELDRKTLRAQLGVILQDFNIYQISVRDNIGVGNVTEIDNRERVNNAATKAGIDKIAAGLPEGMDTIVGRHFGGGCELSIGQRQMLAISKMLMRDAPLLIMDEPTSALDLQNESRLISEIVRSKNCDRKSIILISHRLTSVRHADSILVLESGSIVESGTHDSLIQANGAYARLYEIEERMIAEGSVLAHHLKSMAQI
jgi:ATP-binding cassette subfamily B protein